MLYVTNNDVNMILGGKKSWNDFRSAYVEIGTQAILDKKFHPQVEWAFKNGVGMVFPTSEKDQKAFIEIAKTMEVNGKTFKTRRSIDTPKRVHVTLRVPRYAAKTTHEQWMQVLPIVNSQSYIGGQAWPEKVTEEDGTTRDLTPPTFCSYTPDNFAKGGMRLQFWIEPALAKHIKDVQKGRIATTFGPADILHKGQLLAHITTIDAEAAANEADNDDDEEDEDDDEDESAAMEGDDADGLRTAAAGSAPPPTSHGLDFPSLSLQ